MDVYLEKQIHEDEIKWRKQTDGYALLSCKDTKVIRPSEDQTKKGKGKYFVGFSRKILSNW